MKPQLTLVPQVSIHPNQVNFYYQTHWSPHRPARKNVNSDSFAFVENDEPPFALEKPKHQHLLESDRKANGMVSKTAKKKISKALDYMLAVTTEKKITNRLTGRQLHMKLAFITLTLPSAQIHSDKEIINKCLNQFLIEIKKYYNVKNYIWRAEKQENNNIHFHILIDKFIDFQELRDKWNRIVEKLGYVSRYRQEQLNYHKSGFRVRKELLKTWPYEKQLAAYKRGSKFHWNSPNSTDIHSLQKITNIKSYITKYITKNPKSNPPTNKAECQKPTQTGRIWGCNRELNNLKGARLDVDSITEKDLKKLENNPEVHKFKSDYFISYYINYKKLPAINCHHLFFALARYLSDTFGTPFQFESS